MPSRTQIIDISPEISERTAVFPGDTPFSRKVALDFKTGQNFLLSSIHSTVHLGAHTDAPNHYHPQGAAMHERALDFYYGPCQVISVQLKRGERIPASVLDHTPVQAPRVLFRTDSFPDPCVWNSDFNSLSPELVETLAKAGVILVGIDTPSIDPAEDSVLHSHQAVFKNNLAVLEGIVLTDVKEGLYTLIALPLKIRDADASPVRAVLVRN